MTYQILDNGVIRDATLAECEELDRQKALPPPVPQVISKFQAKAALLQAGLLNSVETLMADPATPALVKLAWVEVQEFRRDSPMIASMAGLLGLTSVQVDALFIAGAGIVA